MDIHQDVSQVNQDNFAEDTVDAVAEHSSGSTYKTPISTLQEYCQKIGKSPQYDLTALEGRAHQPQFVYRCTVGDVVASGQGGSKKLAKHAAAEAVLKVLMAGLVPEGMDPAQDALFSPVVQPPKPADKPDDANPVGSLQELVVARGWRLPEYSLAHETGPAHKKEFVVCCQVETFKEYGQGSAKKHAKRIAATNMYNKIINLPREAKDSVTNQSREAKNKTSFHEMRNALGELMSALKIDVETHNNPNDLLEQLAYAQKFEVIYRDINHNTRTGQQQCLVELNTQPKTVVHGCGRSSEEARVHAARTTLQYVELFTGTELVA